MAQLQSGVASKSTGQTVTAAEFNALNIATVNANATDAETRLNSLETNALLKSGGTMTGTLNMGSQAITNALTINGVALTALGLQSTSLRGDGTYVSVVAGGDVTAAANMTDNALIKGDGGLKGVQDSAILVSDTDVMTGILEATIGGIPVHKTLGHQLTTGVLNGGGDLTVNVTTTLFDISDGQGYVMDLSDADNPVYNLVTWTGKTAITPLFPLTTTSFVYIDSAGDVQQQTTEFTLSQYRTVIPLGIVVTPAGSVVESTIDQSRDVSSSYLASDLSKFLDVINSGNVTSANGANLKLDKSAGETFEEAINRITDANNPNVKTNASAAAFAFNRVYSDGVGGITLELNETDINPDNYDDGTGVLATVANNKYTNLYLYFFANNELFALQYGEVIYDNLAEAKADALLLAPSSFGVLPSTQIRAVISVKKGVTNLTTAISGGTAFISQTGKFGFGGGGGAGSGGGSQDLQATYNLSVTPEILTDSTRGALTVRRGSAADTDNVLEVESNAGAKNFEVTGEGDVDIAGDLTNAALTASEILITDASKTISSAAVATYPSLTELAFVKGLTSAIQTQLDNGVKEQIGVAASDETTDLTTGLAKVTFRMPFAMTLTGVRASVTTAPTGSVITVDINDGGTTVLSTKITIDATEKTSQTAATPPVISDSALADDAEITIDIDTIGSTIAGTGLKVWLIGTRD